jgi:hypothetical protein
MQRQLIAILVLLALVLQGSLVTLAAPSAGAGAACPMGISVSAMSGEQESCCAHQAHVTSCCLDECAAVVAVPPSAAHLTWQAFSQPLLPSLNATLVSRDEAPLIRPPIH